jgi:nitric oxide reductase activation protein
VLGKRAPINDERLFKRRILPGKRDYFVLIGVDVSGSTTGINLILEKKAVMAQCELLARMGIRFAVYAHSGSMNRRSLGRSGGLNLDVYWVKTPDEPWSTEIKNRIAALKPASLNLDGHALEYMRKVLDRIIATDKIILYYSDGKMPAENYEEELEILQREIRTCKRKRYTLLGVGIRTDSPSRHGLDTVQVNEQADVPKVVKHLEKRLLIGR